jgi:hypothetical protein
VSLIGNFDLIGLQHVGFAINDQLSPHIPFLYIKITHKKIKIINGKNFIRSAIEPESIETAIVQTICIIYAIPNDVLYNCSFNTFRFNR